MKQVFILIQQEICMYELTLAVMSSMSPVQVQARQKSHNMERGGGYEAPLLFVVLLTIDS